MLQVNGCIYKLTRNDGALIGCTATISTELNHKSYSLNCQGTLHDQLGLHISKPGLLTRPDAIELSFANSSLLSSMAIFILQSLLKSF